MKNLCFQLQHIEAQVFAVLHLKTRARRSFWRYKQMSPTQSAQFRYLKISPAIDSWMNSWMTENLHKQNNTQSEEWVTFWATEWVLHIKCILWWALCAVCICRMYFEWKKKIIKLTWKTLLKWEKAWAWGIQREIELMHKIYYFLLYFWLTYAVKSSPDNRCKARLFSVHASQIEGPEFDSWTKPFCGVYMCSPSGAPVFPNTKNMY